MIDPSFEELKSTGKLPSPSGIGMEILRLTSDEDCSAEDLVHILKADPALTGRILRAANHMTVGMVEPATTVSAAAVRLGNRAVRNLALGFSLVSNLQQGPCKGFDYPRFWADSLVRAVVSEQLARSLRYGSSSDAFACGLLSNLGVLALATTHPDSFAQIIAQTGQSCSLDLMDREREEYGIDHAGIVVAMMREWSLPEDFPRAVARSTSRAEGVERDDAVPPGLPEILWCAARFACAFSRREDRPNKMEVFQERLGRFNRWDPENLASLWETTRETWPEWCDLLGLQPFEVPAFLSLSCSSEGAEQHLPESVSGACPDAREGAEGGDRAPLHILAVDDDPMSLRLLALRLQKAGYRVSQASDGHTALRLALEVNPQMIIADWMMPEMNGVDLCAALRKVEAGRQMYIILLTSKSEEHQVVEAFDSGVDDYIVKPWRSRLMLARVRAGQRVVELRSQIEEDKRVMQQQLADLGVLARKLRLASHTDFLSGLANRRSAMEDLAVEWQKWREGESPLSVIMIDIDHFKRINDAHGHDAGDEVLREIAAILVDNIGEPVRVARIGGEEFLVLAPGLALEASLQVAERMRRAVANKVLTISETVRCNLTISLGVAERTAAMANPDTLLKAADEALYAAKEAGRNLVCPEGFSARDAAG